MRTLCYLGDWHWDGGREEGRGRQSARERALKHKHPVKDRPVEALRRNLLNIWLAALCSGDLYKSNYRHRLIYVQHLDFFSV